ncbi:MAG: PEP-CTERM sorting domain-containing protein [Alphaproteobacteria bacterium]|nr:PEP-CTERM sorting domain-containing protein [Alphaproteobacteria bacterium]
MTGSDIDMANRKALLASTLASGLLGLASSPAQAIFIDNDIVGDGSWAIDALDGGEARAGLLDPAGPTGATDVIFDYFHYVSVGGGGGTRLGSTTVTSPAALSGDDEVTSSGSFAGENGTIDWTATSSIASNAQVYQTTLAFSSNTPFGRVDVTHYLDEDVLGVSDDHLVVLGTPGGGDFNLLTIDDDQDVGVSHAASYLTAVGMTYDGWAADEFSDLRSAITAGSATYSIAGVVDVASLPPIAGGDPRFPGADAYGPEDITSAINFTFDPTANFASVIFTLGGAPDGSPPPPPDDPEIAVSEPGTLALLGIGLAGLGFAARRRNSRQPNLMRDQGN